MYKYNDDIKNLILTEFGYPTLRVELTDDQLNFCIMKQLTEYQSYRPKIKYTTLDIKTNQSEYTVQDLENETVTGIGLCIIPELFNNNSLDYSKMMLFSYMNHPENSILNSVEGYRIRINMLSLTETIIEGYKTRYLIRFYPEKSMFHIEPIPKSSGVGYITYFTNYHDISEVDQLGKEWVQDRQKQEQKLILGRIRSKYNGVYTPQGAINTDGQQLISEQTQEIQNLKQRLSKRREIYQQLKFIS